MYGIILQYPSNKHKPSNGTTHTEVPAVTELTGLNYALKSVQRLTPIFNLKNQSSGQV